MLNSFLKSSSTISKCTKFYYACALGHRNQNCQLSLSFAVSFALSNSLRIQLLPAIYSAHCIFRFCINIAWSILSNIRFVQCRFHSNVDSLYFFILVALKFAPTICVCVSPFPLSRPPSVRHYSFRLNQNSLLLSQNIFFFFEYTFSH